MIAQAVKGIPTAKQVELLAFIRTFTQARHFPPTVREIGDGVGLRSSSTVHAHLSALERKGLISRQPAGARTVVILENADGS